MTRYVLCEKHKPRYDLVFRVEGSKGRPSWWKVGVESNSTLLHCTSTRELLEEAVNVAKLELKYRDLVKKSYFQHKRENGTKY